MKFSVNMKACSMFNHFQIVQSAFNFYLSTLFYCTTAGSLDSTVVYIFISGVCFLE